MLLIVIVLLMFSKCMKSVYGDIFVAIKIINKK